MFKIGYRAIYQKNIRAAIVEAAQNGFEVLEIHLSSPQFQPEKYAERQLRTLARFAKAKDIILQIHASLETSLLYLNPDLRRATELQLIKLMRFSRTIGARRLTLHPGSVYGYHFADGIKIKNDDTYRKEYCQLFQDSLQYIGSLSAGSLMVCIENTDNFNVDYQKILERYLKKSKIFLTWDIRKNFSYSKTELRKDQLDFVKRNISYVRNLHISGVNSGHGTIGKNDKRFNRILRLFKKRDLPIILEVLPLQKALESKKNLEYLLERIK